MRYRKKNKRKGRVYQNAAYTLFLPTHCFNCKYFFLTAHDWLIQVPTGWLLPVMPKYSHIKEQRIESICVYTHMYVCAYLCICVLLCAHNCVCLSVNICT